MSINNNQNCGKNNVLTPTLLKQQQDPQERIKLGEFVCFRHQGGHDLKIHK